MQSTDWLEKQAQISLQRLLPRIKVALDEATADTFVTRLRKYFPDIFTLLYQLYGARYDFFYHLEQILISAAQMHTQRSADLKLLDQQREANPRWFKSEKMVGGVCYVDLFAGTLEGVRNQIPYFKELGLTYLHLMPLFRTPDGNNDGGYAISDYRNVNPALGTMAQLNTLILELHQHGISVVLDFVFNHTSDEHLWAQQALAGDTYYQDYYYMFDNRNRTDQYEQHLREIFPQQAPGSFTYRPKINKWVWTTFHNFQWDLNYSNPAVFNAMLQEMLFLANQGVDVLRLDAVAFIWKQMGTYCENLPQAHMIIQAFNALVRVATPALLFKSEAIVHPDYVASYISQKECPLSYNPTLMALLWESIATREVRLLRHSMNNRFGLPQNCAWINYVRCHDDIGWTFADEEAAELGMNAFDHRQFLNQFYTGSFEGSFAKGLPFNYNPINHDMRISGMTASLAGLEKGLEFENKLYTEHALARILLIHSIILSVGGIPLIYLGDEIATLNNYDYENDPGQKDDSRWAHRTHFDRERAVRRTDTATIEGQVFQGLQYLINIRKQTSAFASGHTKFFDTGNNHVLGYTCNNQVLVLANFSESVQLVRREIVTNLNLPAKVGEELVSGKKSKLKEDVKLNPYGFFWFKCKTINP